MWILRKKFGAYAARVDHPITMGVITAIQDRLMGFWGTAAHYPHCMCLVMYRMDGWALSGGPFAGRAPQEWSGPYLLGTSTGLVKISQAPEVRPADRKLIRALARDLGSKSCYEQRLQADAGAFGIAAHILSFLSEHGSGELGEEITMARQHPSIALLEEKWGRASFELASEVVAAIHDMFRGNIGAEQAFTNAAVTIAEAMGGVFRGIGVAPADPRAPQEEALAFALTYCTMMTQAWHSGEKGSVESKCAALNRSAIATLWSRGVIQDRSEFLTRFQKRYPDYSLQIKHEIFGDQKDNKHGGPGFAFASVFANAHGIDPKRAPILELTFQAPTLLAPLIKASDCIKAAS